MKFTTQEVKDMCKKVSQNHKWEWEIVYAICLTEGAREGDKFDPSVARLEQGFYRRYTEPQNYATTIEVLLSASYGVPQMMGQSLLEADYFTKYFATCSEQMKSILGHPMSQFAVPNAIDKFCVDLETQITYMCIWLNRKLKLGGSKDKAISLYNGDTTGAYLNKVLSKYTKIKNGEL